MASHIGTYTANCEQIMHRYVYAADPRCRFHIATMPLANWDRPVNVTMHAGSVANPVSPRTHSTMARAAARMLSPSSASKVSLSGERVMVWFMVFYCIEAV